MIWDEYPRVQESEKYENLGLEREGLVSRRTALVSEALEVSQD